MAAIAVAHVQPAQVAGPAQAQQPQLEDNQQEEDNPNNHQPEDNHRPEEEAAEVVEAVEEAAEANQQPDKQQPDKQQPHHPAAEALKGMIPQIFQGDRKDAERFMQQFGAYRFLNRHNSTFTNKAEQVAYAITFIKGPQVDDWAYDMADQLSIKVEGNPTTGDPPTHAEKTQPSGNGSHELQRRLHRFHQETRRVLPSHKNGTGHGQGRLLHHTLQTSHQRSRMGTRHRRNN